MEATVVYGGYIGTATKQSAAQTIVDPGTGFRV